MKTVKTANGFKKINDLNSDLVPVQLRIILQEHRATLIDKLVHGDLLSYIDYKFNLKPTLKQLEELKTKLGELKSSGIDLDTYRIIFEAVLENEFTSLDNSIFYMEIDSKIKSDLFQPNLFNEEKKIFLN